MNGPPTNVLNAPPTSAWLWEGHSWPDLASLQAPRRTGLPKSGSLLTFAATVPFG
jgi:hypothetical protein